MDTTPTFIALLEDDPRRSAAMRKELARLVPDADVVCFDDAQEMMGWMEGEVSEYRLICLDHDLGPSRERYGRMVDPGLGRDVANWLATKPATCPVLIHSSNERGASAMQATLEAAGWQVERVAPFADLKWIKAEWAERAATLVRLPRPAAAESPPISLDEAIAEILEIASRTRLPGHRANVVAEARRELGKHGYCNGHLITPIEKAIDECVNRWTARQKRDLWLETEAGMDTEDPESVHISSVEMELEIELLDLITDQLSEGHRPPRDSGEDDDWHEDPEDD